MDSKSIIGQNIFKQRMIRGLSQEELGELLGVSRQSVSKWELGTAVPDTLKIVTLAKMWQISTDMLLTDRKAELIKPSNHMLNWGIYLVVKDFKRSIHFYEQLLERRATMVGMNRFAQFRFNGNCVLSIMNEKHLSADEIPVATAPHKFVLNLGTNDLGGQFERISQLKIGPYTDISSLHPTYYFFNLVDPDYNLIEITGEYYDSGIL